MIDGPIPCLTIIPASEGTLPIDQRGAGVRRGGGRRRCVDLDVAQASGRMVEFAPAPANDLLDHFRLVVGDRVDERRNLVGLHQFRRIWD